MSDSIKPSDFDLEKEQGLLLEALRRDVRNLMSETSQGKLSRDSSKNLVDYIKLLFQLEKNLSESAQDLTEEQLQAIQSQVNKSENRSKNSKERAGKKTTTES